MTLHSEHDAIRQAWDTLHPDIVLSCDHPEAILKDPAFWQALSKARGWTEVRECPACFREFPENTVLYPWFAYAIRYFQTVLSGGDTKEFWQSLP